MDQFQQVLGRSLKLKKGSPDVKYLQTVLSPLPCFQACRENGAIFFFLKKNVSQFFIPLPFGSQDVTGFFSAHLPPLCCLAADHTGDNSCLGVRVQHKNLYLP